MNTITKTRSTTMRRMRHAMALAAIVASTQVLAGAPAGRQVKTAGELTALCSVSADDPSYAAAMGFCLGYIDAALDYHAALTSGVKYKPFVCPHAGLTREEVVTVFLEWSKANPQQLENGAPVEGVMRAVYEKWPCSGR
jgi:hypothetical protein